VKNFFICEKTTKRERCVSSSFVHPTVGTSLISFFKGEKEILIEIDCVFLFVSFRDSGVLLSRWRSCRCQYLL